MEQAKKILNIAIAFSIMLCSLSIFIYSLKGTSVNAKPMGNYSPVGIVTDGGVIAVIGYNATNGDIKILAQKKGREMAGK